MPFRRRSWNAVGHAGWSSSAEDTVSHVLILRWRPYSELQQAAEAAAERETAPSAAQKQVDAACEAWLSLRARQKQEEQEAELKDPGWAGPTEQLVRQYIESQLVKHPVERFEIDCRTTYCSITASGNTPQSQEAFSKAAQHVATEPWSDFTVGGFGGSGAGEDWTAHGTYTRRRH